jgi:hypothetical protein
MRGDMRPYASATVLNVTILNVTMRLFRIESLLEQFAGECDRDHSEALEKIRLEMKAAADALQQKT